MWDTTRTRSAWVGLLMVLAIFIANGAITMMNLWRIRKNALEVEESHEFLGELKTLRIRVVDAETGMRGFVISQRPEFLHPYRDALKLIADTMGRLEALTQDDPTQAALFARLQGQVNSSLEHISHAVGEASQEN